MHQSGPAWHQRTNLVRRIGARRLRWTTTMHFAYPPGHLSFTGQVARVLDPKLFDDLSRRVAGNLPRGFQALQDDLERNLRSALESALGRLNLVTREEFEVQQAVLLRTREKLKAMESRVEALERAPTARDQ